MGGKSDLRHIEKQQKIAVLSIVMDLTFTAKHCAHLWRDGLDRDKQLSELASFMTGFVESSEKDGTPDFLESINEGLMNTLKKGGLYADVCDDTGEILNDPASVTKDDAAFWVIRALVLWRFAMGMTAREHLKELVDLFSSDPSALDAAFIFFMKSNMPTPAEHAPPANPQ
jgi:hypothetical protein